MGSKCRVQGSPTMMFDYKQPAVEAKSEDDGQMDGRPCVTRYQDCHF